MCWGLALPVIGQTAEVAARLQSPVDTVRVNALNQLAFQYRTSKPDTAIVLAKEALALAAKAEYPAGRMNAYNWLSRALLRKDRYTEAADNARQALLTAQTLGDHTAEGYAYTHLGSAYRSLGQYPLAMENLLRARKAFQQVNDLAGQANALNAIAILMRGQENFLKAAEYFQNTLNVYRQQGDSLGIAQTLNNLALTYVLDQQYAKAVPLSEESIRMTPVGSTYLASHLTTLGQAESGVGAHAQAIETLTRAEQLAKQARVRDLFAFINAAKAQAFLALAQPDTALVLAQSALAFAEQAKRTEAIQTAKRALVAVYESRGDYRAALGALEDYTAMRDSSRRTDAASALSDQEAAERIALKENELRAVEAERNAEHNVNILLSLGLVLVALLGVVVVVANRRLNRVNRQLAEQQQEIKQQSLQVNNAYEELRTTMETLHELNGALAAKDQTMLESLTYANRIQHALLPSNATLHKALSNPVLFYRPRDIVSGDFYWVYQRKTEVLVAVADCTGHGVPGALVSIIGQSVLGQVVREYGLLPPEQLLAEVHERVATLLRQGVGDQSGSKSHDGMDIALVHWNQETQKLRFAGANRPLYLYRNGQLEVLKGTAKPIGGLPLVYGDTDFTGHVLDLTPGTRILLCSDGIQDQFGGEQSKKLGPTRMQDMFQRVLAAEVTQQADLLGAEFSSWQGNASQTDDVLVLSWEV